MVRKREGLEGKQRLAFVSLEKIKAQSNIEVSHTRKRRGIFARPNNVLGTVLSRLYAASQY